MNKDCHLISEAYKTIVEQDVSAFKKAAFSLGFNPNLTPEEKNKLIYDQKKRDVSYGGFKAVQDFQNQADQKYAGIATVLPSGMGMSPQKIQLDYIQRLDGTKPGDPLSYYNTKNPNWFYKAYQDEKNQTGPFNPNWNYQAFHRIWSNDRNSENAESPLGFVNIYRDPFEQNQEQIRNNIAVDNYGNALTFGKPSPQQDNSGLSSLRSAINQFNAIGAPQHSAPVQNRTYKHNTTKDLLDKMGD